MNTTIKDYEKMIEEARNRIMKNVANPHFFEETPVLGMHDTGNSFYETELANIRYYEIQIDKIKEAEKKEAERNAKLALKAEKLGLTLDEYKDKLEKERKARALKAKANRYREELEELNERKAYIEKWLKENEG